MSIESLAELLRFQSELAVDRAKQNIEQQKLPPKRLRQRLLKLLISVQFLRLALV